MIADQFRKYVIKPSLESLEMWSEAAQELLLGTACHESGNWNYLKQIQGPALGFYQIEPATHRDVWNNFLTFYPDIEDRVIKIASKTPSLEKQLTTNLAYATSIARLIYYRQPEALPEAEDIEGLARYWKQYYNTPLGKGRKEDFINNYNLYCR